MSLFKRTRRVWHPAEFHYGHRLGRNTGVFEGWYFKSVDPAGQCPCAVIPGVFLGEGAHGFVQFLDGRAGRSSYYRFGMGDFEAAQSGFDVRLGPNRFSSEGIELDLHEDDSGVQRCVRGQLAFGPFRPWPVTWTRPGVMGPYAFIPRMECNHGILSLDHEVAGAIEVDGESREYTGGRGYVEKDWGSGFPKAYVWVQTNHFAEPGTCLTASVARIPWLTGAFRGFIAGFLCRGALHAYTTYNGSRVERLVIDNTHVALTMANSATRIEVRAEKRDGALLHAPYEMSMVKRVAETMVSVAEVRLTARHTGDLLFEGTGSSACLETQGDLDLILDRADTDG